MFENTQAFLQGHTDRVSCLAVSSDGKRLASGQDIEMGFKVHSGDLNACSAYDSSPAVQSAAMYSFAYDLCIGWSPDKG